MASPLLVWELLVDRRVVGVVGKRVNTRNEICGLSIAALYQKKLKTAKLDGLLSETTPLLSPSNPSLRCLVDNVIMMFQNSFAASLHSMSEAGSVSRSSSAA